MPRSLLREDVMKELEKIRERSKILQKSEIHTAMSIPPPEAQKEIFMDMLEKETAHLTDRDIKERKYSNEPQVERKDTIKRSTTHC